IKD
ncbi:hypothetical protein S40288_11811, partial [Stachybotrys chartarum IBT 40288]